MLSPGGRRFLKVKPTTLEYGYPRRNAFQQPVLERILCDNLKRYSNVTALFETELVGFAPTEKAVTIELRGNATAPSLTCDYLIGCDSGRSFV